jgi:ribosomal-protein-alanine N-acetyltransferase
MVIESASFGRDAYDRNLFAEYFHNLRTMFLVVERGGRVCGYAIACIGGDRAELISIAIDPRFRRKGAASALMDSLLRRARRRGASRISLIVKATNRAARTFYASYGFLRMRRVRRYYEDGSDGWHMVKRFW